MKRRVGLLVLAAGCGNAWAHGSIQGIDHFSGGILHPLVEPTHLLALVALGLLLGQRGIAKVEKALFGFAAGIVVGLLCAGAGRVVATDVPLLAIATVCGLLVALALALPEIVLAGLAMLLGAGIGVASNPESFAGTAMVAALAGAGLGAVLWLVIVAAVVGLLKRPWLRVLVRVVGSWAGAASILVLALWLSGKQPGAPVAEARPAGALQLDTGR